MINFHDRSQANVLGCSFNAFAIVPQKKRKEETINKQVSRNTDELANCLIFQDFRRKLRE